MSTTQTAAVAPWPVSSLRSPTNNPVTSSDSHHKVQFHVTPVTSGTTAPTEFSNTSSNPASMNSSSHSSSSDLHHTQTLADTLIAQSMETSSNIPSNSLTAPISQSLPPPIPYQQSETLVQGLSMPPPHPSPFQPGHNLSYPTTHNNSNDEPDHELYPMESTVENAPAATVHSPTIHSKLPSQGTHNSIMSLSSSAVASSIEINLWSPSRAEPKTLSEHEHYPQFNVSPCNFDENLIEFSLVSSTNVSVLSSPSSSLSDPYEMQNLASDHISPNMVHSNIPHVSPTFPTSLSSSTTAHTVITLPKDSFDSLLARISATCATADIVQGLVIPPNNSSKIPSHSPMVLTNLPNSPNQNMILSKNTFGKLRGENINATRAAAATVHSHDMGHQHIINSPNSNEGELRFFSMPSAAAHTEVFSTADSKQRNESLQPCSATIDRVESEKLASPHSSECSSSIMHDKSHSRTTMEHDHEMCTVTPVIIIPPLSSTVEHDDDLHESLSCSNPDSNSLLLSLPTNLRVFSMVMSPTPAIPYPYTTSVSGMDNSYTFEPLVGPFNDFSVKPDQPLTIIRPGTMRYLDPIGSQAIVLTSTANHDDYGLLLSPQLPTALISHLLKVSMTLGPLSFILPSLPKAGLLAHSSLRDQERFTTTIATSTYPCLSYETEDMPILCVRHLPTMDHRDKPIEIKRAPTTLTYGKPYENRQPKNLKKTTDNTTASCLFSAGLQ